ncbi:ead/Ea22-like family protein, partial [Pseudomonas aeruginosa]
MTDHAELRRLSEVATPGEWRTGDGDDSLPDCVLSGEFVVCEHAGGDVDYIAAANPKTVLALLDEIDGLNDELSACTEHPGGCGYWREAAKRRTEERDQFKEENEALR